MIAHLLRNTWIRLALRLSLGGIFIYAGVNKIIVPQSFADSIATFQLLPYWSINLFALGLPTFEVVLGGLLVLGLYTRMAGLGILFLTATFSLALLQASARGLTVDCGCFGSGASSTIGGWWLLGRGLLLGATALVLLLSEVATIQVSRPSAEAYCLRSSDQ